MLSFAQKIEDKKQIEKYLENLNNQDFDEQDFGSDYEEKYFDAKVIYSSDSLLKIFTFSGKAYFAYFTSISKSYLHILNKKKQTLKIIEDNFDEIKAIHKLSENNYLILEKSEEKISAVHYISSLSAKWLTLSKNKQSIKFNQIDLEKEKLTFSTSKYDLDYTLGTDISYNTKTHQLVFEYDLMEESENENDFEPTHFMRISYEWKNGIFILLKEEKLMYQE